MEKEQLQAEIKALEAKLTGDMFQDMDIKDEIHNLKMKLNGFYRISVIKVHKNGYLYFTK